MSKKNKKGQTPGRKKHVKYNGRDYLLLEIIAGATKAGVYKDRRKENNKKLCRKKVNYDD